MPPAAIAISTVAVPGARPKRDGHGPARIATHTASASRASSVIDQTLNAVPGSRTVSGSASSAVVGGVMKGRSMTMPAGSSVTCRACSTCWSYSSAPSPLRSRSAATYEAEKSVPRSRTGVTWAHEIA